MPVQIDRRSQLTQAQFLSQYVARSRPVILTDATAHWPARQKWNLRHFAEIHGDKQVFFDQKAWNLKDFIDQLGRSEGEGQGASPYLKEVKLDEQFPELWPDVGRLAVAEGNLLDSRLLPRSMRLERGKTALFIGAKGSGFRKLHFDYSYLHVFISQIHGPKDAILFPPSDARYVYPSPAQDNQSLIPDPYSVCTQAFPEFARADATRLTIAEGETLFIPAGWWHATQINQPSIAIAESALDRHNWQQRADWYERSHARAGIGFARRKAVRAYMKVVGAFV